MQNELNGLKILIVDDSSTVLEYTKSILIEHGANVLCCSDMWITSLIYKFKPDLILMDVFLGTTASGNVAVKALKKQKSTSNIAIALYSSQDEQMLKAFVRESGADGFIQKGLSDSAFVREVRRLSSDSHFGRGASFAMTSAPALHAI